MLGTFFGSSPPPKLVTDLGIITRNWVFFGYTRNHSGKGSKYWFVEHDFSLFFFIFWHICIQIDTQKYPISGITNLIHHIPKRNQPTSTISSSFAHSPLALVMYKCNWCSVHCVWKQKRCTGGQAQVSPLKNYYLPFAAKSSHVMREL